jgi:hypothetical protein
MKEIATELARAFDDAQRLMKAEIHTGLERLQEAGASPEDLAGVAELLRRTLAAADAPGFQKSASGWDGRSATIAALVASIANLYDSASTLTRCAFCGAVPQVTSAEITRTLEGLYDFRATAFDLRGWTKFENESAPGRSMRIQGALHHHGRL